MSNKIYIGWDVGAWHCASSPSAKSSDSFAVIVCDQKNNTPRFARRNFGIELMRCDSAESLVGEILGFCEQSVQPPLSNYRYVLAIDAPLGFPKSFRDLLGKNRCKPFNDLKVKTLEGESKNNAFLYRQTERELFADGVNPISAVGDRLGSHATKAMYVLNACKLQLKKAREFGKIKWGY